MGVELPCCDQELYCLGYDEQAMDFMIVGREIGEQGTSHLQGFVYFKDRKTLAQVKRMWPRAHLEVGRGSVQQNVDYCSKDGRYCTHGNAPAGQGARTDLDTFILETKNGATIRQLLESHPSLFIRYPRGVSGYIAAHQPARDFPTRVLVYWGDTGAGKTRAAFEQYPDAYWFSSFGSNQIWFDGYEGQTTAIFDEFYGQIPFNLFLQLTDRYPCRVPIKGGFVQWRPRTIVFTSNVHPHEWYSGIERGSAIWGAFLRRLDEINHFT